MPAVDLTYSAGMGCARRHPERLGPAPSPGVILADQVGSLVKQSGAVQAVVLAFDCPARGHLSSSTLLSRGEGGGQAVEGDGLAAQGACAEDDGEHDLQFAQGLVEGHPGAGTFGSCLSMVQKA